jgi:hypothetical protein
MPPYFTTNGFVMPNLTLQVVNGGILLPDDLVNTNQQP